MRPLTPLKERLLGKRVITQAGCWQWCGATNAGGYGIIGVGRRSDGLALTHRVAFEIFVGPIPHGMHIDHLCLNRLCFNPEHLEAVTQAENNRRTIPLRMANYSKPKQCKRGHRYTEENTIVRATGWLACRSCTNAGSRRRRQERNAA